MDFSKECVCWHTHTHKHFCSCFIVSHFNQFNHWCPDCLLTDCCYHFSFGTMATGWYILPLLTLRVHHSIFELHGAVLAVLLILSFVYVNVSYQTLFGFITTNDTFHIPVVIWSINDIKVLNVSALRSETCVLRLSTFITLCWDNSILAAKQTGAVKKQTFCLLSIMECFNTFNHTIQLLPITCSIFVFHEACSVK